jgi:hypothetical protein
LRTWRVMLNSDRLTERALLPVAFGSSPCIGTFAGFPADTFPATTISESEVVPSVPADCATRHRIGRFKDMDIYDSSSDGITDRSQYSGSANREALHQNHVNRPLELPSYFLACFLTFAHRFFAALTIAVRPAAERTRFFATDISSCAE